MVEGEPNTPAMVIKTDRKQERDHEENCEHHLVMGINDSETRDVSEQNHEFGRHHVNQDRSDEEALLTFKDNGAGRAPVLDLEQPFGD